MPALALYEDYSREDVHDIFSPDTPFYIGAGSWGLSGIINIPGRTDDFIFMVTYGSSQSGHDFDEPITDEGVITWQSQPNQRLHYPQIRKFMNHDELTNSIYLFLRTQPARDYTYLGNLKYLSHDIERESPVWFQWQILDWDISPEALNRMGLELSSEGPSRHETLGITVTAPPSARQQGAMSGDFRSRRMANSAERDARNKSLGTAGEELVVRHEKEALTAAGRSDLAEKVSHVAVVEGDGAGYDVRSYTPTGDVKYIEVKTTRSGINTSFYITSNEVAFSSSHAETFYLYRLWNFNTDSASMYILKGDVSESLTLDPVNYRAAISS